MNRLFQDVRYAIRMLRKSRGAAAVIVLSLAIGIGANTASSASSTRCCCARCRSPTRTVWPVLWLRSPGIGIPLDWPSPGQYIDLLTQNQSFEEMALSQGTTMNLTGLDQPQRVDVLRTSSTSSTSWGPSRN